MPNGSIRQRAPGSWEVRYDLPPDADGKRRQRSETVKGSKQAAQRVLRQRLAALDAGTWLEPSRETVAEYLTAWLDKHVAAHRRPATVEDYRHWIRLYVAPHIGHIQLQRLAPRHVQQMVDALRPQVSPRTIAGALGALNSALNRAVQLEILSRNPAARASRPAAKPSPQMWEMPDIHRFLESLPGARMGDLFHAALLTGLRRGELCALKLRDLDLQGRKLTVERSLNDATGELLEGPTKSGKARAVDLGDAAAQLFAAVLTDREARKRLAGSEWSETGHLFTQPWGGPIKPDAVTWAFRAHIERAGLPHLRFHGLRHAHATLLLAAGVNVKVVSERLGHSHVAMTYDVYAHVMPQQAQAAAKALDDYLAAGRDCPP